MRVNMRQNIRKRRQSRYTLKGLVPGCHYLFLAKPL
jgi:rRNA maturation protein Nop10